MSGHWANADHSRIRVDNNNTSLPKLAIHYLRNGMDGLGGICACTGQKK
jgi:hypothetical protein